MANVYEFNAARRVSVIDGKASLNREFRIIGVDSEQAALNAMLASGLMPTTETIQWPNDDGVTETQTLSRTQVEAEEMKSNGTANEQVWSGTVKYSVPTATNNNNGSGIEWTRPPEIRWSMSLYTETVNQKIALGHTQYGGGPDHGDCINVVNRDGIDYTEGAPVLVPAGVLRGAKTYTAADWNDVVARASDKMCKTNSSPFTAAGHTFAAGELLFVGAEARLDSEGNVEVEFQFLYSPNGNGETDGINWNKDGWQYLWPYIQTRIESGAQKQTVIGVYVDDMYYSTNFGDLFS